MHISRQNRQLVTIGGGINLFFLLLSIAFFLYLGHDYIEHQGITRKAITFTLANSICWIVNLFILAILVPVLSKRNWPRWLSFYLPSYLLIFSLAIIIANAVFSEKLSDDEIQSPIFRPIFFVIGINTLSLVAIELILARYAQSNIRLENANMKAENAELKMKSLQAQHEKLKNQLHPHFLFNSLTALKSLIRKDPELAENYVVKLSGFLRFSMSHNEQNIVPLEEELKFSLYYLEMQKIRFRNALIYTVEIPDAELKNASLPVFSLQLILENAIKHNRLTQEQPLNILIRYLGDDWLLVENNIHAKLSADPASGIGLKNLSDRYRLLIQENITIENDSRFFRVQLKMIRE
jgi:sensor histidine kinase YesM